MGRVFTVAGRELPDEMHEEAAGRGIDPMELFEERLQAVSEWAESVSDGNEEQAIVYAVNEIYRTVDRPGDEQMVADSDIEQLEDGRVDLRQHTK